MAIFTKNTEELNSNDKFHLDEMLTHFKFGYKYHSIKNGILIFYNGFNFMYIKVFKTETEMVDFGRFIAQTLLPKIIEMRKEKNPLVSIKLNKFVGECLEKGDTTNAFRAIYSEFVSPITAPLLTRIGETVLVVDSDSLTMEQSPPHMGIKIPEANPEDREAFAKMIVTLAQKSKQ